ncbi:hypothetical protein RRG08_031642 [Elysia crispata]|uniref:Uncharacterized protein n=1 Tax=Elysia crispata TaxID=231223 RepID=A0AAE1AH96_9GAST|nr:hypothetical protein RRG08_031642 [Elysia crispata]
MEFQQGSILTKVAASKQVVRQLCEYYRISKSKRTAFFPQAPSDRSVGEEHPGQSAPVYPANTRDSAGTTSFDTASDASTGRVGVIKSQATSLNIGPMTCIKVEDRIRQTRKDGEVIAQRSTTRSNDEDPRVIIRRRRSDEDDIKRWTQSLLSSTERHSGLTRGDGSQDGQEMPTGRSPARRVLQKQLLGILSLRVSSDKAVSTVTATPRFPLVSFIQSVTNQGQSSRLHHTSYTFMDGVQPTLLNACTPSGRPPTARGNSQQRFHRLSLKMQQRVSNRPVGTDP